MKLFNLRKRASAMALGIALATGAVAVTGAFGTATPAHAQKPDYSREFRKAYTALDEATKQDGFDLSALQPQFAALRAMAANQDEKLVAGQITYNTGIRVSDQAMQLTGMELMLASGKVPPETAPRYNYIAYQLANATGDFGKARGYLQNAIALNYTSETITPVMLKLLLAEINFSTQNFREGIATLDQAIAETKANGQTVDERWYRRGVSVGVNNKVVPEVYSFAAAWVSDFPSDANWRDAINLTRNLNRFESPEMLDLLRLSRKVGTLDSKQDVIYYVETADARRLPLEVKNLIEQAIAANPAVKDDIYLADQLKIASDRIPDDRPTLPDLEAEADGTTTDTKIVMAAGDTFYSYGDYAKAERFFAKAAGMPGVEMQVALTRLGISQIAMGKLAEGKATLAKVTGDRAPIAQLWIAYANNQGG